VNVRLVEPYLRDVAFATRVWNTPLTICSFDWYSMQISMPLTICSFDWHSMQISMMWFRQMAQLSEKTETGHSCANDFHSSYAAVSLVCIVSLLREEDRRALPLPTSAQVTHNHALIAHLHVPRRLPHWHRVRPNPKLSPSSARCTSRIDSDRLNLPTRISHDHSPTALHFFSSNLGSTVQHTTSPGAATPESAGAIGGSASGIVLLVKVSHSQLHKLKAKLSQ